jgi:hypothetical protein
MSAPKRELLDVSSITVRAHGGLVVLEVETAHGLRVIGMEPRAADALGSAMRAASTRAVSDRVNVHRWGSA